MSLFPLSLSEFIDLFGGSGPAPPVPTADTIGSAVPIGVPHLVIPFAVGNDGTAVTVQQGTSADVVQCVANLVGTRPGTRLVQPAYGIPDPTFGQFDRLRLGAAVRKYEPRAQVTVQITPANDEVIVVGVIGGNP